MDTTREKALRAWRVADRIGQLSDNLVSLGRWGIGVDGVLAWVPGVNVLYSAGAGAVLMYEGVRAGCSGLTLTRMGVYLTARTAMAEVPLIGWAMDALFRGHLMAARALQKDVERRFGAADVETDWRAGPIRPGVLRAR